MNAAAAAAAALSLGCTDREIVRGLAAVRAVGRRLRIERLPSGVLLLDDCYNANPASMKAALATLRPLAGDRAGASPCSATCSSWAQPRPTCTGSSAATPPPPGSRRSPPSARAPPGPRGRPRRRPARGRCLPHRGSPALAAFLRERLRPGDVLLVKGSRGMKLEQTRRGPALDALPPALPAGAALHGLQRPALPLVPHPGRGAHRARARAAARPLVHRADAPPPVRPLERPRGHARGAQEEVRARRPWAAR